MARRPAVPRARRGGADADQVLLRPRRGDVQHAQLLGQHPTPQPRPHDRRGERRVRRPQVGVGHRQPDARLAVDRHRPARVGQVVLLAQVGQHDDGELEPLRPVDAHQSHRVRRRRRGARPAEVVARRHVGEERQEPPEPLPPEAGELPGAVVQLDQVRHPLVAAGQPRAKREVARLVVHPPQQLGRGAQPGEVAPAVEPREHVAQRRGELVALIGRVPHRRLVERHRAPDPARPRRPRRRPPTATGTRRGSSPARPRGRAGSPAGLAGTPPSARPAAGCRAAAAGRSRPAPPSPRAAPPGRRRTPARRTTAAPRRTSPPCPTAPPPSAAAPPRPTTSCRGAWRPGRPPARRSAPGGASRRRPPSVRAAAGRRRPPRARPPRAARPRRRATARRTSSDSSPSSPDPPASSPDPPDRAVGALGSRCSSTGEPSKPCHADG